MDAHWLIAERYNNPLGGRLSALPVQMVARKRGLMLLTTYSALYVKALSAPMKTTLNLVGRTSGRVLNLADIIAQVANWGSLAHTPEFIISQGEPKLHDGSCSCGRGQPCNSNSLRDILRWASNSYFEKGDSGVVNGSIPDKTGGLPYARSTKIKLWERSAKLKIGRTSKPLDG